MGYIKEPKGIDLVIPPSKPDKEADQAVSDYIKKQKLKNGKKIIEPFLTMSIQKDIKTGWYVGQIEEFPGAISQGKTIKELKANLLDALKLLLEIQKENMKFE